VATHADADESVLDRILRTGAGYVSLVASRRRAAVILERLDSSACRRARGRLKAPAGLDIGAVTPEEIAVSILAEVIQYRRSGKTHAAEPERAAVPAVRIESKDPICGMMVDSVTAKFRRSSAERAVYFCCRHCKEAFDQDPERYRATLVSAE
jgi:xanthine dehydrogenase accessory factor